MLRAVAKIPTKNFREKTQRVRDLKLYKPVRCYSKDICPPQKKPPGGGSGTMYTLGALALVGGATIGYAKYDEDFRKTLVTTVPFTDNVIRFVFQEDQNIGTALAGLYEAIKKYILALTTSSSDDSKAKKGHNKKIVEESNQYKAQAILPEIEKEKKKPQESYAEIRLEPKDKPEAVKIVGEVKPKPEDKVLPEAHPKNLAELEDRICVAATEAVNAYNKAIYNLKVYNKELSHIIDHDIDRIQPTAWDTIKEKTKEKNDSIKLAEQKAGEAARDVAKLKTLITKPEFVADPSTKEMVKVNIQKVQDDIADAKRRFEIEQKLGSTTERYWEKVEAARKHFVEELEALFPTVNIGNKQMMLSGGELDLLLVHAYAHVLFYQKELAKMETVAHERLQFAVEQARRNGGEYLTNAQVCEAVDQEKRRLTELFQRQCLILRKEAEAELRDQLKRQSQVFTDHLEDAVQTRALEIERVLARKFDEQLEAERTRYKMQLACMVGRLRGLDNSLKAKENADQVAKQSQVLWSACQALLRAIKSGCAGIPWKEQLRPLEPEITSVQKAAAPSDELVEVVIKGIPKEAKERGVFPENALRERFLKVEKMARSLALVPEDGAALPLYILSYLQSLLLIESASPIPQAELADEKVDFSKLNTNEILQRARYWLDRGDFAQTLKYMNLLKGAPRSIARQWMNETRILLETQQAANTLMAHAASSGLMYL